MERLEELKIIADATERDYSEFLERYKVMEDYAKQKINTFIQSLTDKKVELLLSFGKYPYRSQKDTERLGKVLFEIRSSIYFINEEDKRDFGSSIDLKIFNDIISVNVGTCGEYNRFDIYQVARVKLLNDLFEKETEIVELANSLFDIDLFNEEADKYIKMTDANDVLKAFVRTQQKEEKLKEIKNSKYLIVDYCGREINGTYLIESIGKENIMVRKVYDTGLSSQRKRFELNNVVWHLINDNLDKYYELKGE